MKNLLTSALLLAGVTVFAQTGNLKLHYDFQNAIADTIIPDVSGNGYDGLLKNDAYTDQMGTYKILNLGNSKGYLDMGAKTGELVNQLQNFTISTYVCVSEASDLGANGNFIWTFSNSDDIIKDQNGCLFLSAKTQGYSITKSDYRAESGIQMAQQMAKKTWKHIVYTQSGYNATLYIDGAVAKTGSVVIYPNALGKTTKNYIGKSSYISDLFLNGLIADFRIYDRALTATEVSSLTTDLTGMRAAYVDYLKKPQRFVAKSNPLFTHKYTADPSAMVYNNVFYIYSGQDTGNGSYYNMPNWLVFSSTDLETWEEHPVPLSMGSFSWATGNSSWASQVVERNGKFYWYVSTEHATVPGKAIGVAVSDSPTGPFIDARGTAIVTNNMTTAYTGISWDDIDPTVLIDDDGQAFLFWGNTQCYYAKLKDNMIELASPIMPVTLPKFTEAPWIHKKGDWYYLSYASGFPEKIGYAMSQNINGPWVYKGILNEIAGNSNTNHQAIVEYRGKWYFVYHNGSIETAGGSYLRSVCMDYLYYNDDNTMKRVQMTSEGVDKVDVTTSIVVSQALNATMDVYPNPTDKLLNVELHDASITRFDASLYNMLGVKQLTAHLKGSNMGAVDVSQLPAGNYVLQCSNDKHFFGASKIIIK